MDIENGEPEQQEARAALEAAIYRYYGTQTGAEDGALVTAYVMCVELTTIDGKGIFWISGDGSAQMSEEEPSGLHPWRIEGMLRFVIRQSEEMWRRLHGDD